MEIHNQLKELRRKAKKTQKDVSEALGYTTPQFISNWERGISMPPPESMKALAKIYKISVDELIGLVSEASVEIAARTIRERYARHKAKGSA